MKTTRTFRYLTIAAAAALSLTLASCSGSDDADDSSSADETTASEQTGDAETTAEAESTEDEATDDEATEDGGDAGASAGAECLIGTWEVTPEALEESILAAYGGEGEAEAEGVTTIAFDGTVYTMNADTTVSFSVDMDGTPLEGTTVTNGEFVIAYTADDTAVTFGEVKSADGTVTVDLAGQSSETNLSDTAGMMAGVSQDYTCTDTELTVITEVGDTQIEQTYTRS